jgi:hypothetical protein
MRSVILVAALGLTGAGLLVPGTAAEEPVVEVYKTPT